MNSVNYTRLKQTLSAAGYPVSAGTYFQSTDMALYERYLLETPFRPGNAGVVIDPAADAYGLTFPQLLPAPVANNFSAGVQLPNVTLWSEAINPSTGYMYLGTGNPVSNFQCGNGVNIQLGIAIKWKLDGTMPLSNNGVYNLPRLSPNNGQNWTFAFSIASLPGFPLTDYNVTLTASLDSTGATTPVISFALSGNTLVSTPAGTNITDNEGITNQVVQNIESYTFAFLKDLLLPESMQSQAVPYGTYYITLSAQGIAGTPAAGDNASCVVKAIIS
jgi:hypothetical protein